MAIRKPLVVGSDGLPQQLQAADTLNISARFTATATVPAIALLGTTSITFTVVPAITGDALAVGEPIDVYATGADLPAGLVIGQARVVAANSVKLTLYAILALSLAQAVAFTVVAHR
ncbi:MULTISPECIES: hypothetical protein [Methylobacterium]|uniref:Uncharacterized protein n=3 Tax=Pseudomonadota TaxID=1224 RepID=A0ABQ4SZH3_9HYPH|nr:MULTISPECIES: hypothetical protein [Methylobacterium]PIU06893.1 MAG: hypothetical protein COT56_07100 [Methylobacterium sp. CG09_land_8_20_14_0_10_71_15]PIU16105.1 MAG: hypothetical protein COT28_01420 [Methylobacterium sp. CG08_land_8_20_14_0_20_71_15]GBU19362.1 hypothetical protein AwMethylo_35770 [Methylobacterium sp.]GJE08609.1 hypothetical protein AOPFMNJM_3952 [Methylobacterium jeotgali]